MAQELKLPEPGAVLKGITDFGGGLTVDVPQSVVEKGRQLHVNLAKSLGLPTQPVDLLFMPLSMPFQVLGAFSAQVKGMVAPKGAGGGGGGGAGLTKTETGEKAPTRSPAAEVEPGPFEMEWTWDKRVMGYERQISNF